MHNQRAPDEKIKSRYGLKHAQHRKGRFSSRSPFKADDGSAYPPIIFNKRELKISLDIENDDAD